MRTALEVNVRRMQETLARFSSPDVGGTPDGGVSRPALSDFDKAARERLLGVLSELGLEVRVDDLGSIYGRRAGTEPGLAPVVIGSHLDTVEAGGRFDGILGVVMALEAVRVLDEHGVTTRRPVEVVSWTAEEGARFPTSMLATAVLAGAVSRADAYALTDAFGLAFGDELKRIGFAGSPEHRLGDLHAYLEMHIEQGTVLEEAGAPIGVVSGISPVTWWNITVRGRGEHAGGPGPGGRRDAMVAASRMVVQARDRSLVGEKFKATVGVIHAHPGSKNVVPNEVTFVVDLRARTTPDIEDATAVITTLFESIAAAEGVEVEVALGSSTAAVSFDANIRAATEAAAARRGHATVVIHGAIGHDALHLASLGPAAMIFTPTVAGLSHCPQEGSPWEDIAKAAAVYLDVCRELADQDDRLPEPSG